MARTGVGHRNFRPFRFPENTRLPYIYKLKLNFEKHKNEP